MLCALFGIKNVPSLRSRLAGEAIHYGRGNVNCFGWKYGTWIAALVTSLAMTGHLSFVILNS
ncbi:MAG: hypothetical protein WCJ84_01545 [Candidatus Peregrinibacteria bacterium]